MLPKAVLSFVGRLVGIAAVLASPLAAQAAESSAAPSSGAAHGADAPSKPSAHHASPSHGHKKADRKAGKRGSRHLEAKEDPTLALAKEKSAKAPSHSDSDEVTTERASTKAAPKPSSTPLPTLAAVTATPLAEPISTKAVASIDLKGHGVEPRRTPIIHVSTRPESEKKKLKHAAKEPCLHAPIDVMRGTEEETFALTKCDGTVAPLAVERMSILVRPGSAAKPSASLAEVADGASKAKKSGDEVAPGIKKIDERLVERLEQVIDHFAKPTSTPKVFVVSGYRPTSKGSFHAMGRAIDFRIDGVENTDLVAFCKTLPDTGCGFYPNSSFIHLDVRDAGTGHVAWIDASGPGEKPEYIAAWPPPPKENDDDPIKLLAKLDELQLLPAPSHEAEGEDAKPSKDAPRSKMEEPAVSVTRKLEDQ